MGVMPDVLLNRTIYVGEKALAFDSEQPIDMAVTRETYLPMVGEMDDDFRAPGILRGAMHSIVGLPGTQKTRSAMRWAAMAAEAWGGLVLYIQVEEPYQPDPSQDDARVAAMMAGTLQGPDGLVQYRSMRLLNAWPSTLRTLLESVAADFDGHIFFIVDGATPTLNYTLHGEASSTTAGGIRSIVRNICAALSRLTCYDATGIGIYTTPVMRSELDQAYFSGIAGGSTVSAMLNEEAQVVNYRNRFVPQATNRGALPFEITPLDARFRQHRSNKLPPVDENPFAW
jgi:hypothetical protein